MLVSGLTVICYTAPGQNYYPPSIVDYTRYVDSIKFTTLQPGGYGQLTFVLRFANARVPRPELALFSHVVVMAPAGYMPDRGYTTCLFIGEMTQPEMGMDSSGEYINCQALGIGNCLRDDPHNVTYFNKTGNQILNSEMTANNRANWMPLSTDQSLIFPDNPAISLSPSYMGYGMEDIINDVCLLAGDYAWGVWAHEYQRDSAGYPLGQVVIHLRNSTTTHYQAYMSTGDFYGYRISPSADRAYNAMTIYFTDASNNNNYGSVSAVDSRLNANLTQGTAPFRYRRYLQDFTGTTTVTATTAGQIETTQLAIMKNVTNKTTMTLKQIRNDRGSVIPLWSVTADHNISAPELSQRGQLLALGPTPGVNLFYILQTEYSEDSSGTQVLTLQTDNWYDFGQTRLARLELSAYRKAMAGTTTTGVQALGSPSTGICGFSAYNANAGATFGEYVTYPVQLAGLPTSITLSLGATVNANSIAASSITNTGFFFGWTSPAAGATEATRNYATVGNCLLAVDVDAGTFDHHCDGCDTTRTGLSITKDIRIATPHPGMPGDYSLCVDCPTCGTIECFNARLLEADEYDERHPHRAEQARYIRSLQRHKGLARAVKAKVSAA